MRSFLLLLFGISACVMIIYAGLRIQQIGQVRQQVRDLDAQPMRPGASGASVDLLKKKFPQRADISSFIEGLYRLSDKAGLQNVDISTLNDGRTGSGPMSTSVKKTAQLLTTHQIRISCEGKYRAIAQYLAQINDVDRYSRVVSFDLKPSTHTIKANIVIEITSVEVHNAS